MSPAEFRAAIETLGLSQVAAGRFLGGAQKGQRYATGATPVPKPVALLLAIMITLGLKPEDVESYGNPKVRRS